ncbi:hypothetical protein [Actinopolyspora mortivallis]|uniref:Photosynthesis system II assembly factor Ycf48/Hcf136-like domain-containing protein n=1 Tax=Actinopolyspora mortivallis TaxID=33906 RepID=A0A2T0GVB9_ACTMO|nr:hypothetical protein [Actinopolyspora mortivallis]PRW63066.1 hypothetical protein CEP50_12255 [Actinopolyspora mortivallis]
MTDAAVPHGFVPTSTSWTNAYRGWILGFAGQEESRRPVLLHTETSGFSWSRRAAPQVEVSEFSGHVRVHAMTERDLLVTNGETVFATHDGATHWHLVELAEAGNPALVGDLASNEHFCYAVVTSGDEETRRTRLLVSPVSESRWEPVTGIEVPGPAGGSVVATGGAAFVALGGGGVAGRYWVSDNGTDWRESTPPCAEPYVATWLTVPPADPSMVFALCSYQADQPPGHTYKDLKCSLGQGEFRTLGRAPAPGISRGLAVSTPLSVVVSSVGGGFGFLFRSTDGGREWETALRQEPPMFLDLDFQDPVHGVVLRGSGTGRHGAVLRTFDGGASWQGLSPG